jgi:MFS family permease
MADKVSRRALILVGGFFFSCLIVIVPSIRTFSQLLLLSVLSGFFGALVLPAATAIMVEEGRDLGMGSAMSMFNMSMSLGLAAGAPCAGWLADWLGLSFVFYAFTMVGLLGTGYFGLNYRRT